MPLRPGGSPLPAADRTLHRGNEIRIHPRELGVRPPAVLLVAGPARGAHEGVLAAVEIARRLAAPPLAVVGHEYAGKVRVACRRRYAEPTDK